MSRAGEALRLARSAPRPVASWLLLVAGALLLVAAEWVLWADEVLFDADAFSQRAVRALDDEDVQEYVSAVIVDGLIEEGSPDLIAARPLIEAAVQAVIGSVAFEQLYETALRETHRTLFSEDPIVLQIVDASVLVKPTLAHFNPELAESIPDLDTEVLQVAESDYLHTLLTVSERVRILSLVLPLLAFAAFVASWGIARGRRRAVMRIGMTLVIVAVLTIVLLDITKAALAALVGGGRPGAAVEGVWDAFLGDVRSWNVTIAAGGAVMATAASPWFAGFSPSQAPERFWRLMTAPGSNAGRLVRAVIAVFVGWAALVSPRDLIEITVALLGLAAVYLGLAELIRLLWVERATTAEDLASAAASAAPRPRLSPAVRVAAVAALLVAGVVTIVVLLSGVGVLGGDDRDTEAALRVCNGHAELCDRPLNEVAFAATHNSMSAASEGWFFATHRDGIAEQLDHGIRGLLIDVWFGSPARNGVSTELLGGDRDVMVERYGLDAVETRERIAARLGPTSGRELYLCHGFCELGRDPAARWPRRDPSLPRDQPGRGADGVHPGRGARRRHRRGVRGGRPRPLCLRAPRRRRAVADPRQAHRAQRAAGRDDGERAGRARPLAASRVRARAGDAVPVPLGRRPQLRAQPRARRRPAVPREPLDRGHLALARGRRTAERP